MTTDPTTTGPSWGAKLRAVSSLLLNWQNVRSLRRMTLLNRVALILLVAVPILTALLPKYRSITRGYNKVVAVTQQRLILGETADGSQDEAQTIEPEPKPEPVLKADAVLQLWGLSIPVIHSQLDATIVDLAPQPIPEPELPRTWALAFFAALAILLGDTVSQLFCPEVVRERSCHEYVDHQRALFSSSPSAVCLETHLQRLELLAGDGRRLADRERSRQQQEIAAIQPKQQSALDPATAAQPSGTFPVDSGDASRDIRAQQLSLIELGSREVYERLAHKVPLAIFLAQCGYICGGLILLKILQEQSIHVARAAGWL